MKLNERALEAAAQANWERSGYNGSFRVYGKFPEHWVEKASNTVLAYMDALDAEGLADLYDYWCERIEALPVPDKIRKGDLVACSASMGQWRLHVCSCDLSPAPSDWRILRRAHQPRQWKIGDLVDDTRNLPDGTVVRDEAENTAEYVAKYDAFTPIGIDALWILDAFDEPHIIWLPENGDES